MGTLLFQVSQLIRSIKDMLVSIDAIKHFLGKIGDRYSFKKKLESQHENTTLSDSSVNEVMKAVMTCEDDPSTQDPVCSVYRWRWFDGTIWPVLWIDVTNLGLTRARYSCHQRKHLFREKSATFFRSQSKT